MEHLFPETGSTCCWWGVSWWWNVLLVTLGLLLLNVLKLGAWNRIPHGSLTALSTDIEHARISWNHINEYFIIAGNLGKTSCLQRTIQWFNKLWMNAKRSMPRSKQNCSKWILAQTGFAGYCMWFRVCLNSQLLGLTRIGNGFEFTSSGQRTTRRLLRVYMYFCPHIFLSKQFRWRSQLQWVCSNEHIQMLRIRFAPSESFRFKPWIPVASLSNQPATLRHWTCRFWRRRISHVSTRARCFTECLVLMVDHWCVLRWGLMT